MPQDTAMKAATHAVVFAPLDTGGRAEVVAQRLTDAIVSGMLGDGERLPSESDLARRLGVAVVTAREALESLRDDGLLVTRRGRDGGSFVCFDADVSHSMTSQRLCGMARVELRDLALHYSAIAGMAAEVAADRATDDDVQTLVDIDLRADDSTPDAARRALARFQLQVAAISQSLRLVHVELRLQAEGGHLLWLCLREQEYRERSARMRADVIRAIRAVDSATARAITTRFIDEAADWLIDEKARLEAAKGDQP